MLQVKLNQGNGTLTENTDNFSSATTKRVKERETRQTLAKRIKFLLFALILCYSPIFYANAKTTITSFTQNGETSADCIIILSSVIDYCF
ncbi:MAG: hypothetical protein FWG85_04705 [Bacteroidetes bacterium]|nr:hypothetical protein [Bacteroidota bacterium]